MSLQSSLADSSVSISTAKVLYVDDEPIARAVVKAMLRSSSIELIESESVDDAINFLESESTEKIDCVITDYNMPHKTGLELLTWCKKTDPTLSTILLTAVGDRDVVKRALSEGAIEFLDKPLSQHDLYLALEKATILTARMRDLFKKETEVQQIEKTQSDLLRIDEIGEVKDLDVFYLPKHEAGGDLIDYVELADQQKILLVADVSGHDLRAAYVSAYIKGVFRGMLQAGSDVPTVLEEVNNYLLNSWNDSSGGMNSDKKFTSISVQVVEVSPFDDKFIVYSAGAPPIVWQRPSGIIEVIDCRSSPLGWDEDSCYCKQEFTSKGGSLFIWTDGIDDLAHLYHGNSLQVLMSSLNKYDARVSGKWSSLMHKADDDLMGVQWRLGDWHDQETETLDMFFNESYYARNYKDIDFIGETWRGILECRFPELSTEKVFDILLLLREVVLNGIQHGCKGSSMPCELYLYEVDDGDAVRIFFRDYGSGHQDNFLINDDLGNLDERNAGLMLIKSISDKIEVFKNGAELLLDISLNTNILNK